MSTRYGQLVPVRIEAPTKEALEELRKKLASACRLLQAASPDTRRVTPLGAGPVVATHED